MKKAFIGIASILFLGISLMACEDASHVASRNISKAADNFEVQRQIVFYNTWTDTYIAKVEGKCAIFPEHGKVSYTCKTGHNAFVKDYLGLSGNVTYMVRQLENADVSTFHYRVVWRPQSVLPNIDVQGNAEELLKNRH